MRFFKSLATNLLSLSWSPKGAREVISPRQRENFDSSEAFSTAAPSLSVSGMGSQGPPSGPRPIPEATCTTAAGLHSGEDQGPELSDDLIRLISRAVTQGFAAVLQQGCQPAQAVPIYQAQRLAPMTQGPWTAPSQVPSQAQSIQSEDSSGEENQGFALSDDKGMTPDPSPFNGLSRPDLFKPLLHKVRTTADLGTSSMTEVSPEPRDADHLFFVEPTVEAEVVPSPQLFLDVAQRQWGNQGTGPNPTGMKEGFIM